MSDKNNNVIVAIDDLTEFYAIQQDIQSMVKRGLQVKILVVLSYSKRMYEDTMEIVRESGYEIIVNNKTDLTCKILLEPYPLVSNINSEFRIRYDYGVSPASLKPDFVYAPDWNLPYDAIVCYSHIAKNIFSAYTKPYIIKPQQFRKFKLHKKTKKINILILLTWGDVWATDKLAKIKEQLGENYNLIIKAHHAVQYRPDHKDVSIKLKDIADEYYDATTNVNRLFEKADVVLTDNSSAVFTAIYLGIPTAIFSEATSGYHSLNGIKAAHISLLIEPKLIPYTSKIEEVRRIIEQAPKNTSRQNKLKDELYPSDIKETLASVVERYLALNRKEDPYYIIRDILSEKRRATKDSLAEQVALNNSMYNEVEVLKKQIDSFLGIKRSLRLLFGNIKRKAKKIIKDI